jgi:uncharacterized membrane protein YcaP (DUF421 family)
MSNLSFLWGEGEHLASLPMSVRAIVMFFIALLLLRLGGIRIFGQKSALDNVIVIMLGAVMARGIVGASPFFSTVIASTLMILINRLMAWACQNNDGINNFIKGKPIVLYEDGQIQWENMNSVNLSKSDLLESLRLETNKSSFENIEKAYLETNGRISFILKS